MTWLTFWCAPHSEMLYHHMSIHEIDKYTMECINMVAWSFRRNRNKKAAARALFIQPDGFSLSIRCIRPHHFDDYNDVTCALSIEMKLFLNRIQTQAMFHCKRVHLF